MASSDTHATAAIAEVNAGYWYCDNQFPTPVADIPSELFTHLFAAFADVNPSTYEVTFPEAYEVQFSTFTLTVQKKNPLVQTLLSIGGGPSTFASMASQLNARQSFIHSSINLARSNDFHGLSLHWQYPSTAEEMTNLGSLLKEWRAAVDLESQLTGNVPLLLVAAVYYRPNIHAAPLLKYPVDVISGSLDWINVVAYELYYNPAHSWNVTGPFAALKNGHNNKERPRCADPGVRAWIDQGVPAKNIVFGLPFYGAAWRLEDDKQTDIFVPADGPADGAAIGVYINPSDGTILYNQIRSLIRDDVKPEYSDEYVVDFIIVGNTWIGYDDIKSITEKVTYAKGNELLGYYAWHVGGDRKGILSLAVAAFTAWHQSAPGTGRAGTGGAGTGAAGTGGAGTGGAGTGSAGTGGASTGDAGTETGTGTAPGPGLALTPTPESAPAIRSIHNSLSFRYQQKDN